MSANDHQDAAANQAGQPMANSPCPHCGQLISPHARRCPHCQQAISAHKPIARPEKPIPSEGGTAWHEAAAQVADLGEITWHDGVHPINLDTHPFMAEATPAFSPYDDADQALTQPTAMMRSAPPPRPPPTRWLALGGGMFFCLALLALVLLLARQQQQSAAQLAAAATHQAALTGGTHGGNGKDKITPQPSAKPMQGGATATATAAGTFTPGPSPTPTQVPIATATPTPVPTATPLPTATPIPPPMLVYAINAGSHDTFGNFVGDVFYQGGSLAHITANIDTSKVSIPAPMQVYQSCRYGQFSYTLPQLVPGANYLVRLHFAEFAFAHTGRRVFNVTANGVLVLDNFDIIQQAGGPNIALIEQFVVTADQFGTISLNFSKASANLPLVNGLEIYTAGPGIGGGANQQVMIKH